MSKCRQRCYFDIKVTTNNVPLNKKTVKVFQWTDNKQFIEIVYQYFLPKVSLIPGEVFCAIARISKRGNAKSGLMSKQSSKPSTFRENRALTLSLSLSLSFSLILFLSLSFFLPIAKKSTTGLNNKWQISSVLDVRGEMIFATRQIITTKVHVTCLDVINHRAE